MGIIGMDMDTGIIIIGRLRGFWGVREVGLVVRPEERFWMMEKEMGMGED